MIIHIYHTTIKSKYILYVLLYRAVDRCRHYMIDQTPGGKYIVVGEPKVHKTLFDLVSYHQKVCST